MDDDETVEVHNHQHVLRVGAWETTRSQWSRRLILTNCVDDWPPHGAFGASRPIQPSKSNGHTLRIHLINYPPVTTPDRVSPESRA